MLDKGKDYQIIEKQTNPQLYGAYKRCTWSTVVAALLGEGRKTEENLGSHHYPVVRGLPILPYPPTGASQTLQVSLWRECSSGLLGPAFSWCAWTQKEPKWIPSCFMVFWIPCIWLLCSQQSFDVGTENSWCLSRSWSSFNLLTFTVIWQCNWCILKPPCARSLSKSIIVPIYLMFSHIENRRHVFTGNNQRIGLKKGFVT